MKALYLLLFFQFLFTINSFAKGAKKKKDYHKNIELRTDFHAKAMEMQNKDDIKFLDFVNEELRYSKKVKDNDLVIDSYSFSIGYLIRKRNFAKAIEYSNEALFYFDRVGEPQFKARIYSFLGSICMQQKEYKEAIEYGKKALSFSDDMKGTIQVSYFLSNIGNAYLKNKEYDKALVYLKSSLSQIQPIYSKTIDYKNMEVVILSNMALCYLRKGFLDKTNSLLQKAQKKSDAIGNLDQLQTRILLCKSYLAESKGNYSEAIDFAEKGMKCAEKLPLFKIELFDLLTKLYEKNGSISQAYLNLKKRTEYVDSLNTSELNDFSKVIELNVKLANKEKTNALKTLHMKMDVKTKRTQNGLLILLVIAALFFGFLLYRNAKIKQNKAQINSKRLELEKRNIALELENRNKEMSFHTMKQAHMNDFILSMKKELEKNKALFKNEQLDYVNGIIRKIKSTATSDIWAEFELRFQQAHTEFYTQLCTKFPNLTPNERRICTFVKMNLSTKEMASITGQTTNSLVVARIRLRKKLGITNEEIRLDEFFNQMS